MGAQQARILAGMVVSSGRSCLPCWFFERQDFDAPKFRRMRLRLDRDVAAFQHLWEAFLHQLPTVWIARVQLGFTVTDHGLAIEDMLD